MSIDYSYLSTGLPELDKILKGLLPGDNVVWHVDNIDEYIQFVIPFYKNAVKHGQNIIYLPHNN